MNRLNSVLLDKTPLARLLCVDPSKPGNNTGVAKFRGGVFNGCMLHTDPLAPDWKLTGDFRFHALLIELPCVYPGARQEDPNDLIQVARAVGQWEQACSFHELHHRFPRQWKGTTPKDIHNRRVLAALTDGEREILERLELPKTKIHNVIDAIGMGLWVYGRI